MGQQKVINLIVNFIGKVLKQSKTNKKRYHLKLKLLVNFNAFKNNKTVTINEQQNDS